MSHIYRVMQRQMFQLNKLWWLKIIPVLGKCYFSLSILGTTVHCFRIIDLAGLHASVHSHNHV